MSRVVAGPIGDAQSRKVGLVDDPISRDVPNVCFARFTRVFASLADERRVDNGEQSEPS